MKRQWRAPRRPITHQLSVRRCSVVSDKKDKKMRELRGAIPDDSPTESLTLRVLGNLAATIRSHPYVSVHFPPTNDLSLSPLRGNCRVLFSFRLFGLHNVRVVWIDSNVDARVL